MSRQMPSACLLTIMGLVMLSMPAFTTSAAEWKGVDETVVEKFAEEAGHPSRKPCINTDQGDLLLFVFLIAGTVGGFIGGYSYRNLFPPKTEEVNGSCNNQTPA